MNHLENRAFVLDALRDLLVMVKLQRMVWETGADGRIPPADSQPLAHVLRTLEVEIYDLAARVLPADAIAKLRALIKEWRRQNPAQHYVAFVRFNNLGFSSVTDEVKEVFASGGFLAPVELVAREAHEARLVAERYMYLANRMPALLGWQAELAYQRVAASPEAVGFLRDLDGCRAALEMLGREVQGLPEKVATERKALLEDLERLVAKERAESMRGIQSILKSEREAIFSGLSDSAQTYGPIVDRLAVTAAATRDAVAAIERLTASRDGQTDGAEHKSLQEIVEGLTKAAGDTKEIVLGLQSLFNAELRGLPAVDAMLAAQAQRFFLYNAVIVLLVGLVLYVVLRAVRGRTDRSAVLK